MIDFQLLATKPFLMTIAFLFWHSLSECLLAEEADIQKDRVLPEVISGYAFQSAEIQALQDDDFASPGLLWKDKGEKIFNEAPENKSSSCADCHVNEASTEPQKFGSLNGAAARYPQYDKTIRKLMNLEQRINRCREDHQDQKRWEYESDGLLAITTYVASLSNGMPFDVNIQGPSKTFFEEGRRYYYTRLGQLNLACNQCHDDNFGKNLRGDLLSQGHSNNYPTYRLDWQNQGSLHRRLRFCNFGVRAAPLAYGSDTYVNLELFLAWRSMNLELEVPSVRR